MLWVKIYDKSSTKYGNANEGPNLIGIKVKKRVRGRCVVDEEREEEGVRVGMGEWVGGVYVSWAFNEKCIRVWMAWTSLNWQ